MSLWQKTDGIKE